MKPFLPNSERSPLAGRRALLNMVIALLLVPASAMQFTSQVTWGPMDFALAAILLGGGAVAVDVILGRTRPSKRKSLLLLAILGSLALIWVELAVGLIGTPLAGT